MKNLVIDILHKLAKTDTQMKDLTAQIEAQSLIVAALVLTAGEGRSDIISTNIEKAIHSARAASDEILQSDADLLMAHLIRLINVSQFVEYKAEKETDIE